MMYTKGIPLKIQGALPGYAPLKPPELPAVRSLKNAFMKTLSLLAVIWYDDLTVYLFDCTH